MKFAIARLPTPVFNIPDLSALTLDDQGLVRAVETILFPQTKIELLAQVTPFIYKIRTEEYPYTGDHFTDSRFLQFTDHPPARPIQLPPKPAIIAKLKKQLGARYIWGGNWPDGIDLFPQIYPNPLDQLKGVDCTGLLYHATNGWTKRNSSSLVDFGTPVPIEGLSAEQIVNLVKPLDIIAWKGHIIIIIDKNTSIESKLPEGVVTFDLKTRLNQIMNEKKPVNDWSQIEVPRFVIRRWYPRSES